MLMVLRVRINNKSFTQFLWILHHFKAIYHSKDMTTNERNLMYICLQRPKLTSVVSCWDTFHVRSRATVPRGKGNAWTAINVFRARRFYESQGRLILITSENIYRKTLQLPETAQNKGGVHFQEERAWNLVVRKSKYASSSRIW